MAGSIFPNINPATTSGNQLATLLNDFKDAVASGFSGTSRPANLQPGGYWVDTTNEASPNFVWDVKVYTGTADVLAYRINLATNAVSIAGASDLFTVEKISADATGPILKFLKERVANNGQVLSNDILGSIQFFGSADDNSNPLVARMRVVSTDDNTSTASGAYLVFESTLSGTTGLTEWFRIFDGNFGIGINSPEYKLHVAEQFMVEKESDDTSGPTLFTRKRRVSGNGQVLNADEIRNVVATAYDEVGAENQVYTELIYATEDHDSGSGFGVEKRVDIIGNGELTPSEVYRINGSQFRVNKTLTKTSEEMESISVGTAASIVDLNLSKRLAVFSGATETNLGGILASSSSKVATIHNSSSTNIILVHNDALAAAGDKILLPGNKNIKILPGSSAELFYDTLASAWKVKSGSGAGSGGGVLSVADITARNAVPTDERYEGLLVYVVSVATTFQLVGGITNSDYRVFNTKQVTALNSLADAGTITIDLYAKEQTFLVEGASGFVTLADACFGASAPIDGAEITLIGSDDDKSVTLTRSLISKGLLLNADVVELGYGESITLKFINDLDLYIEKCKNF